MDDAELDVAAADQPVLEEVEGRREDADAEGLLVRQRVGERRELVVMGKT